MAFTPDEIQALLEELRGFHDESDFEPECPTCWAFKKLQAAYDALTERSAASTGADSGPHEPNKKAPESALSLPIQRLGSAMEGLAEWLRRYASFEDVTVARDTVRRWASEVEALRQRPGAQAASEPGVKLDDIEADFLATRLRRLFAHFDYAVAGFAKDDASLIRIAGSIIGGILANLDRQSAGERPAQAEPMTDEINLVLTDPDSKLSIGAARALRYVLRILASQSARERPSAQAPSKTIPANTPTGGSHE